MLFSGLCVSLPRFTGPLPPVNRYVTVSPMSKPAVGWYPDPMDHSRVRLWDGLRWTEHTREPDFVVKTATPKFRVLPALFLVPVLLAALYLLVRYPQVVALAGVSLLFTIPVFIWFDKLEPEPLASRWNAFVWGAGLCVVLASAANALAAYYGGEGFAAVVSAPLVEEGLKVLGLVVLARQGTVRSPLDGFVYAGYIGLGFALIENMVYYHESYLDFGTEGLVSTFIARGLVTPFVHPFMTLWAGLFIGAACRDAKSVAVAAFRGLLIGVPLHALWNGSLVSGNGVFIGLVALLTLCLFAGVTYKMIELRRREIAGVRRNAGSLAFTYNISPYELEIYGDLKLVKRFRKSLSRAARQDFDLRYSQIVRHLLMLEKP